ncbi:MAG TPA: hypothetical protein VL400_21890 [Polyangiaceae bacterium]|jgi:hypothetical protein|nr:hypothetical protein [Polyangiaceae bacterium]
MVPDTPPTAEGDLAQTPFAHLAVYALDRRLTGEIFLTDPDGVTHGIRYDGGVPIKIRVGAPEGATVVARLGDLLVEEGLVARDTIEGACLTGGLLGDVLVLAGYVESDALNRVLDKQFRARMTMLYELPPETKYYYFDKSNALRDWGGEPHHDDPMALIWQGIRAHAEKSALFEATLDKLGGAPLQMHKKAPLARLCLEEDAKAVIDLIELDPTPLDELAALGEVSPDLVRRVAYALLLLRQLDLGKPSTPVGVEERPASVAKLQLKSKMHRVGAAVDSPGVGERSLRVKPRSAIPREDDGEVPPPTDSSPGLESGSGMGLAGDGAISSIEVGESEIDESDLDSELEVESGVKEVDPAVRRGARASAEGEVAVAAEPIEDEATASGRRLLSELSSSPIVDLIAMARAKLDEKDAEAASSICTIALGRVAVELDDDKPADAGLTDKVIALDAWARSALPHPDLKALAVSLDDRIRARDVDALPRYVRGLLRKRLGDGTGAQADFRRVLELEPDHALAKKEVAGQSPEAARRDEPGFLKRLFRR